MNMHQQGISGHGIAAALDLARGTVRKYIHSKCPVRIAPRTRKPSLLDPDYEYLCQRWHEEAPTAQQLFEELQDKGYQEGLSIIKDFVTRLRRGLSGMKHPPQSINMKKKSPQRFLQGSYVGSLPKEKIISRLKKNTVW